MAWKCSCGGINSDHSGKCSACGTPKGMQRTAPGLRQPSETAVPTATSPKGKNHAIDWIWPMSRVAAVAGLVLYLFEQIDIIAPHGARNPVMTILFILMFTSAIRGTFAYKHFAP